MRNLNKKLIKVIFYKGKRAKKYPPYRKKYIGEESVEFEMVKEFCKDAGISEDELKAQI